MWKGRPSIFNDGTEHAPTFCGTCGTREVDHLVPDSFDPATGAQEIRRICPHTCAHGEHHWGTRWRHVPMWQQALSLGLLSDTLHCVRCGGKIDLDYF